MAKWILCFLLGHDLEEDARAQKNYTKRDGSICVIAGYYRCKRCKKYKKVIG